MRRVRYPRPADTDGIFGNIRGNARPVQLLPWQIYAVHVLRSSHLDPAGEVAAAGAAPPPPSLSAAAASVA